VGRPVLASARRRLSAQELYRAPESALARGRAHAADAEVVLRRVPGRWGPVRPRRRGRS
jgi:hypothetical protein